MLTGDSQLWVCPPCPSHPLSLSEGGQGQPLRSRFWPFLRSLVSPPPLARAEGSQLRVQPWRRLPNLPWTVVPCTTRGLPVRLLAPLALPRASHCLCPPAAPRGAWACPPGVPGAFRVPGAGGHSKGGPQVLRLLPRALWASVSSLAEKRMCSGAASVSVS